MIVLGLNNVVSGQLKFQIINPCTINYNSLPTSNTGSTGGSGGSKQVDPRTIYYTATTFSDTTSNTTDWTWSFGDATPIKAGKIVQHQYLTSGTYTVTLNRKINGIDQPPATEIVK